MPESTNLPPSPHGDNTTQARFESAALMPVFMQYFHAGDFTRSLRIVTLLLQNHRLDLGLVWYRCCCLVKMGEHRKAVGELQANIELAAQSARHDDVKFIAPPLRQLHDLPFFQETLQQMPGDICLLYYRALDWRGGAKRLLLLNRLIEFNPLDHTLYEARASLYRALACNPASVQRTANNLADESGTLYSRDHLQAALRDYRKALLLEPSVPCRLRCTSVLHLLHKPQEAMTMLDEVLRDIPPQSHMHQHVLNLRTNFERLGARVYDETADMVTTILRSEMAPPNKSGQHDAPASSSFDASSWGGHLNEQDSAFLESILSSMHAQNADSSASPLPDGPPSTAATPARPLRYAQLVRPLFIIAGSLQPEFMEISIRNFPRYQTNYLAEATQQLKQKGYGVFADLLPRHVTDPVFLDQASCVVRFLNDQETGVAVAYALRPVWRGIGDFVRRWIKARRLTRHCMSFYTAFDNGYFLRTSMGGPNNVFDHGPRILQLNLPRGAGIAAAAEEHRKRLAAFRRMFPYARTIIPETLPDMEKFWLNFNLTRAAYRRSIGYISESELQGVLKSTSSMMLAEVRREVAAMLADARRQQEAIDLSTLH